MKRLTYLIRELESRSYPLALECDRIMIWNKDLLQEKKDWVRTFVDLSKHYGITIPQPLMIEITLALLED